MLHHSIGFTGTRQGMTAEQKAQFISVLMSNVVKMFHHGDCRGADADAHDIVLKRFPGVSIVIHPPKNPRSRAWKKSDNIHKAKEYLERNKDIVNSCELLVATPNTALEVLRSGTWSTIRFAEKIGKPVCIILPDGSIHNSIKEAGNRS